MNIQTKYQFFTIFILLFSTSELLYAAEVAGNVDSLKGTAWAQIGDEPIRQLNKNDAVYVNDTIKTEARSSLNINFKDETRFELGPDAELQISDYLFQKPDKDDNITMKVFKGTFRFFSGLIARKKPESMRVNTTVATIGIRGTHVIGEVDTTSSTIIMMEPEDKNLATSIEVSNQFGSVLIDEPGFGTEIPDEFSPPSPPRRMRLETINNIMRSVQSIQRMNMPRPR
ncbi:MAG: hypothetical protein A2W28_04340 [Gammaproteobacteria bacterium RBG_16_51_14]|nr:MAG: hypothetical protein A2W28_04340 [Gammaproteobacteria bacterium RBG_16_51_14]